MGPLTRLKNQAIRGLRGPVPIWYHEDYRLPMPSIEQLGVEPRRADLALWYLLSVGAFREADIRRPGLIRWEELAAVHSLAWLESLTDQQTLARIFAVDAWSIPVDQVLRTMRLACAATRSAAQVALDSQHPTLNLLGGFHHAGRSNGGGFCPVNDIAVAVAALRAGGFSGPVAILDLDVHPPDGTADCLADAPDVWIGSLSGAHWDDLPESVDETVLPAGTTDGPYLKALEGLLERMPAAPVTFVIAGGDPWEKDALGPLAITAQGLRDRDLAVAAALRDRGSVWLPGGGYGSGSWRPLAGTGMAVALGSDAPIPPKADPLHSRFSRISTSLNDNELAGEAWLTEADLADVLGLPTTTQSHRMLGFYTAQGSELALHRFGILPLLRRLGYDELTVEIERGSAGDRMQLHGTADGARHLLVESELERRTLDTLPAAGPVLFVHWLTLRHPLARFSDDRPPLPGQDAPGLGIAREAGLLLAGMAERLSLPGVALRPSWYHVAYASRYGFQFADPERQGRFEALTQDLSHLPLLERTQKVADGAVKLGGQPYTWEADEMVFWREGHAPERPGWSAARDAAREAAEFTV